MIKHSCEQCPLVIACGQVASDNRQFADTYDSAIREVEAEPKKALERLDELDRILSERVAELTYDSMSSLSDEELIEIHSERKQRDKIYRNSEEIALSDGARTQIDLIQKVQQAYQYLAEASERYALELQANCRQGPGSIRRLGIVGTKYYFCRSGDKNPNLEYFIQTTQYADLKQRLEDAHIAYSDFLTSRASI